MKYCTKCGNELFDEAVICTKCGCVVDEDVFNFAVIKQAGKTNASTNTNLSSLAMVFMIIGTVFMGFSIIPLAWCLPMTIIYNRKIKNGEPISTGFKVCSLLFVNTIAGILMLCDNN